MVSKHIKYGSYIVDISVKDAMVQINLKMDP
jgi:hypothetical protein